MKFVDTEEFGFDIGSVVDVGPEVARKIGYNSSTSTPLGYAIVLLLIRRSLVRAQVEEPVNQRVRPPSGGLTLALLGRILGSAKYSQKKLPKFHRLAARAISSRRPNWEAHIVLYFGIIMLLFGYVDRYFSFYRQPIPRLSVAFWPA
jgi:hypothetical protein